MPTLGTTFRLTNVTIKVVVEATTAWRKKIDGEKFRCENNDGEIKEIGLGLKLRLPFEKKKLDENKYKAGRRALFLASFFLRTVKTRLVTGAKEKESVVPNPDNKKQSGHSWFFMPIQPVSFEEKKQISWRLEK